MPVIEKVASDVASSPSKMFSRRQQDCDASPTVVVAPLPIDVDHEYSRPFRSPSGKQLAPKDQDEDDEAADFSELHFWRRIEQPPPHPAHPATSDAKTTAEAAAARAAAKAKEAAEAAAAAEMAVAAAARAEAEAKRIAEEASAAARTAAMAAAAYQAEQQSSQSYTL